MKNPRITPPMIETARARMAQGDSLKLAAAHIGVDQSALGYHLRGGKQAHYRGKPWAVHLNKARKSIGLSDLDMAIHHLKNAVNELESHSK